LEFIQKHWRGEYALGAAFWANGVLLSLVFGIFMAAILVALGNWSYRNEIESPVFLLSSACASTLITLSFRTWQIVGIWRSAGHEWSAGRPAWPIAVRCLLCVSVLLNGWQLFRSSPSLVNLVALSLRELTHDFSVKREGDTVFLRGLILPETAVETLAALNSPGITRLDISGPGGLFWSGKKIETAVHRLGTTVIATGECDSICTIILADARQRVITPKTHLGFHSVYSLGSTGFASSIDAMREDEQDIYRWAGASDDFVQRATGSQTSMLRLYRPGMRTLIREGIATDIEIGGRLVNARAWCDAHEKQCRD